MARKERNRTLRRGIFLSFLVDILPVVVVLVVLVEFLLVPAFEARVRDELTNATNVLSKTVEGSASASIRNHLKGIAERARDVCAHYTQLADAGVMTREEATARSREFMLSQRVGTSGYIYCMDSDYDLRVHPLIEGQSLRGYEFARQQIERKDGYIEYEWQNPGDPSPRAKALYMVYYEPLDWIISASSYRSEFGELLNPDDIRDAVLNARFGESGYAYVFDRDGTPIVHPFRTGNLLDGPDEEKGILRTMLREGSGAIEYEWRNPGEDSPREKIAIYNSLPDFGWLIGASAYLDEVMAPVRITRWVAYSAIALLGAVSTATAYFLSVRVSRPIETMVAAIDRNARAGLSTPLPETGQVEFRRLAGEINTYMARVEEQRQELRQQEARYRSLFEASPDAVFVLRGPLLVACNPATCALFGGAEQELIGTSIIDLSPPRQPSGRTSMAEIERRSMLAGLGTLQTFEWAHQTLDGRQFLAEVRLKQFAAEGGEFLQVAFVRDITERRQAETALRQERDFSRALVDSSPAFIAILDQQHRVRLMNPAFREALGRLPEEVVGADCLSLAIAPSDREWMRQAFEKVCSAARKNDRIVESGTTDVEALDGHDRAVHWSITWLPEYGNDREALLMVGLDVTETQALQVQLNHAQKLDAVGRLAGGVAHDFNNMLGGIAGAAELLSMKMPADNPGRPFLALIMETVERASELAGRLLAFSRKGKSVMVAIDLNDVLGDVFRILRSGLGPHIETELELAADNTVIIGDLSQLHNTFLNLFINARDAMPEGGALRVATRNVTLDAAACEASPFAVEPGLYVQVTVTDTGVGMDEATMVRAFEPFFTTKAEGKGTGLGLSSAYGAVEGHRGEILVQSCPGEGTKFTLRFPCSSEVVASADTSGETVRGEGTILFVDDDEVLRKTGQMLLESLGYDVIVAKDGADAVEQFRHHQSEIDLVVLDMVMPHMNGADAFRQIHTMSPGTRVVLASGFSRSKAIADLEREGLLGFVRKPYTIGDLSKAIAKAIATPRPTVKSSDP